MVFRNPSRVIRVCGTALLTNCFSSIASYFDKICRSLIFHLTQDSSLIVDLEHCAHTDRVDESMVDTMKTNYKSTGRHRVKTLILTPSSVVFFFQAVCNLRVHLTSVNIQLSNTHSYRTNTVRL